jgi:cytoskeletal protein RodZ
MKFLFAVCVNACVAVSALAVSHAALAQAAANEKEKSKDLSVKLYGESTAPAAAKEAVKETAKEGVKDAPKETAKAAESEGGTTIIRCVDRGRVTFTNGKCETGQAQTGGVQRSAPAQNQITRSTTGQAPKPLAALPPLYETVQATSGTAGYELREQCGKLNSQLARLDAQAQLALPKPEPEANRKRREDIERKKFSLRCP